MRGRGIPSYERPKIRPKVLVLAVLYLIFVIVVCGTLMYTLFNFKLH